jgi:uncharacterized protein (TIGR03084 family)
VADLARLLDDLEAESADLDRLVAGLDDDGWLSDTPAQGWTVRDTVTHLGETDRSALLAVTDPDAFLATLPAIAAEGTAFVDRQVHEGRSRPLEQLLPWWREGRRALADAMRDVPAGTRVPWYGPPMAPASFVTARLMETWAHGQDVADALGVTRRPTDRLRSVAHLGVRTRGFAYLVNGREAPADEVHVRLDPPGGGEAWMWGDPGAQNRIEGPALDWCLLVTRRRHRDDLALTATGEAAAEWLTLAQAFAGPPGAGRAPGASFGAAP